MSFPNFSLKTYLVLVFLSGILVGGVSVGVYHAKTDGPRGRMPFNPDEARRRYAEELRTRLSMRPEQVQRLQSILTETHQRFRDLREKYRPEVKAIQDDQADKIRAILDPEQRKEYERLREERERRRQQSQDQKGWRPDV